MKRLQNWLLIVSVVLLFQWVSAPARAQLSCFAGVSNLAFGTVDVLSGLADDSAGTITTGCTGIPNNVTVLVCYRANNGTYPLSGGQRQMGSGANRLLFQMYQDAARTIVWDSSTTGQIGVVLTSANPTATTPFYGQVPGAQQIVPPGSYTSNVTVSLGGVFSFGTLTAASCPFVSMSTTRTVAVSATVTPSCLVTTTNMNFGNVTFFTNNVDTTGSVLVTCTNGTPYHVRLNGGLTGATNPAARRMTLGANQVTYGLYRNAARTLPWGETDGVNTDPGTGTATVNTHTVYGRIPPQPSLPPGTYIDTVIATVSY
jgi:spore coat protein U-like protein